MMPDNVVLLPRHGAAVEEWWHLAIVEGLTEDLLPVVSNPRATIAPSSALKALGKVPSIYNQARQVVGLAKWTERRTERAAIETWAREPDYGICIQTREVRALDLDIEDAAVAARAREIIETHLPGLPVRTRSNSAKCLYAFRLPGVLHKRALRIDGGVIEFLATGQQFVAHGRHPSGPRYEWPAGPPEFPVITLEAFDALWAALAEAFGAESIEAPVTQRHTRLSEAAMQDPLARHLVETGWVRQQARDGALWVTCPWEHEHTTDSGPSATVYFPAHTGGYEHGGFRCLHAHCADRGLAEFRAAVGFVDPDLLAEFTNLDAPGSSHEPSSSHEPDAHPYRVVSAAELCARPSAGYWVKHVLPRGELAVVYGEPGSGKSFFALDLAMAVARGEPWRGKRVRQGRVVYIAAEGQHAFGRRVQAYANTHGLQLEDVPIGFVPAAPNLLDKEDAKRLLGQIRAYGRVDIIMVDTLAQTMPGGDENSSESMGTLLRHCKALHHATGALIVLVHHAGKDLSRGARGWSGLKAAADVEIEITRGEDDVRVARMSKLKDDEDGARYAFELATVVVGVDEDGESLTSCVCEPVEMQVQAASKVYRPKGVWEAAVLQALRTLGEAQTAGIEVEAVVEEAKRHTIRDEDGKDRRGSRLRRAIEMLAGKGVFELDGETGCITLPKEDGR